MSTVRLIPPDDLTLPALGDVKAGVPVDVPIELAGRAPDPEREVQMQALAAASAAHDHAAAQKCRDLIVGTVDNPPLEMGYGLLAQGWELAPPAKTEKKPAAAPVAATGDEVKEG